MEQERRFSVTDLVVCAVLFAAIAIAYYGASDLGFVSYDDPLYVTQNSMVQKGLTVDGLLWALKTDHAHNWNPLTWISHMVDYEIHGSDAQGHHGTSLLLHIANSLLLYLLLRSLTGATWRSAVVAALFALHPLHVETVAWVSDRKGLVSTLFLILSSLAYVRYVRTRSALAYSGSLGFLAFGLLAKPMLVTLPFLFLLLDGWPLCRFDGTPRPLAAFLARNRKIFLEKIPFFLVIAGSCAVTYLAQQQTGAVRSYEEISLLSRVANAFEAYIVYMAKTFVPLDLAFFYPHPAENILLWRAALALGALVALSLGAVLVRKKYPFFFVGWFWFVGTLVPVIGIVQIGRQALADRFSYVPLIGLFIAITWGLSIVFSRLTTSKMPAAVIAVAALIACVSLTRAQVETWHDDVSLCRHALEVTDNNFIAHSILANHLMTVHRYSDAKDHYAEARRIFPAEPRILINLGKAHLMLKDFAEAESALREALVHHPENETGHLYLAWALTERNMSTEAEKHLREVVRLAPDHPVARFNLGVLLLKSKNYSEAEIHFAEATRLDPKNESAKESLQFCRSRKKQTVAGKE